MNQRYRRQLKGRLLRELMTGEVLAAALEEHRLCVRHRAPVFTRNTDETASLDDIQCYQRLLLPMSTDGHTVDRLLGVMAFDR